jgi:hypothetical protein
VGRIYAAEKMFLGNTNEKEGSSSNSEYTDRLYVYFSISGTISSCRLV